MHIFPLKITPFHDEIHFKIFTSFYKKKITQSQFIKKTSLIVAFLKYSFLEKKIETPEFITMKQFFLWLLLISYYESIF